MLHAIAEAYTIDEVKDIRDQTLALQILVRKAKNREAERQVCEIRLRAEREIGRRLSKMEKAKGATERGTNRGTTRSHDPTASKTLAEFGITKDQSAQWQRLAAIPNTYFEATLTDPRLWPSTKRILAFSESSPSVEMWSKKAEEPNRPHIALMKAGEPSERTPPWALIKVTDDQRPPPRGNPILVTDDDPRHHGGLWSRTRIWWQTRCAPLQRVWLATSAR
jgi:hypothetical protein